MARSLLGVGTAFEEDRFLIKSSNVGLNLNTSQDIELSRFSEKHLVTFAAFATVTILVVGLLGNLLTVLALLRCPRVRNVAAAFIISLCVADCLFCILVLPFSASRFIFGTWIFNDTLCVIIPLIRYGNVGISLLSIAMITINRYIMIAHYGLYTRIYKPIWIACMIVFCWILSFGMMVPTLFRIWGQFNYDSRLGTCTIVKDVNGRSAKTALFIIGFVIPCLIIVVCYARIFWVVHSSESRMRNHAAKNAKDMNNGNRTTKEKKDAKNRRNEWRITKMVLAIFLSFIICYLPITIVKVVDSEVYHPNLHLFSYILLYMSACINPIIYVIMNKQYRQAYKTVLMCSRPRMLSTTPAPGSSFGGSNGLIMNDITSKRMTFTQNINNEQRFRDKSKDDVSRTMVSQVSVALPPIRMSELPQIYDDHL